MGGCHIILSNFLFENLCNKMLEKYMDPSLWGISPILQRRRLRHRSGLDWPNVLHLVSGDILFEIHAQPAPVLLL